MLHPVVAGHSVFRPDSLPKGPHFLMSNRCHVQRKCYWSHPVWTFIKHDASPVGSGGGVLSLQIRAWNSLSRPYNFPGLALPSGFGAADDDTVRGPTAPGRGPGPSRAHGVAGHSPASTCLLPSRPLCKRRRRRREEAAAGMHPPCAHITDTQHRQTNYSCGLSMFAFGARFANSQLFPSCGL